MKKITAWGPHRKWLLKTNKNFEDYPEEIEYQSFIKETNQRIFSNLKEERKSPR